jgi:hypothetical protein
MPLVYGVLVVFVTAAESFAAGGGVAQNWPPSSKEEGRPQTQPMAAAATATAAARRRVGTGGCLAQLGRRRHRGRRGMWRKQVDLRARIW